MKPLFLYLNTPRVRTARFYTLPKIHKRLVHPPGRPIVSANKSPTERISQFVDHFLNPIMKLGRSYIRDTFDFIRKLEKIAALPRGALLVTLDVKALYPSIPKRWGIRAVSEALKKYRPNKDSKPSNGSILALLNHVLDKNDFVFNGGHYLQIQGTAMGTKCAPAYANIFMNQFEDDHVYTNRIQPKVWFRFIDDIFAVFTCSRRQVDRFVKDLNNVFKDQLVFTAHVSNTSVDFLDTTVKFDDNGKLYTTLYTKPTDTHDYLLYSSAHPRHCKQATPYSQLLRLRKICKKDEDFVEHSQNILGHFHRRGYPMNILKSAWNLVKTLDRDSLLIDRARRDDPPSALNDLSFYLTTTFNPASPNLKGLLTDNWDLLQLDPKTDTLEQTQVKKGFKRPPNLRDKLCRATVEYPPRDLDSRRTHWDPQRARTPCERDDCQVCPLMLHTGRVISHITGRTYHAPIGANCESNNLIYLITCKKCKTAQYVGETYHALRERIKEHLYYIRSNRHSPVAEHFNLPGHARRDVQVEVLSYVYLPVPPKSREGTDIRRSIERKWIHKMKTNRSPGLNILD